KKFIGAEALLRWQHHEKGFISPEEFIPLAEHHGQIIDIGKFVTASIGQHLPSLLEKFGNDFLLAMNVSMKEFASETYVEQLVSTVRNFNLLPNNIELEITETSIMNENADAVQKMKSLREHGFNIALDDFGTGYSSLAYLKKFPVNKIKIDRSFVLDIVDDHDDNDMVKAIIDIANIFKLQVQAEGVETVEQLNLLKEHGAHIAQGYYFSKPLPLKEILANDWQIKKHNEK
ncbi:MAG: EAL domain-containing protein, partial [Gammaproteobacteria bacterium]|nr:EAL domain-containing protein [Gammaproteobacteria bacterium]